MKVLLTGFNPFGDSRVNPSQLVVESLSQRAKSDASVELIAEVLPTEFVAAGEGIVRLIQHHRPDCVICLGFAAQASGIRLERVALNLNDAEIPDNAGHSPKGALIFPDAPLAYWSTLPIETLHTALQKRGIPSSISNHAGTYVCNHVFYTARHEIEVLGLGSPCGFIHVPDLRGSGAQSGLSLETMVEAIELCISLAGSAPSTNFS